LHRRLHIAIVDRKEDRAVDFWKIRSAEDRVGAVEFLREQFYAVRGHTRIPRMTKTLRLVDRSR
jgi:hypothetical protein